MVKGRILTPEGFFPPLRAKMLTLDCSAAVSPEEFWIPLFLTSGTGDQDLWSLVFIPFEINALVLLDTSGQARTLPCHVLNFPCTKEAHHLHLPFPRCKTGAWTPSIWGRVTQTSSLCWASPWSWAAPPEPGRWGWDHQDRALAGEPRATQLPGGLGPEAEGQRAPGSASSPSGCLHSLCPHLSHPSKCARSVTQQRYCTARWGLAVR